MKNILIIAKLDLFKQQPSNNRIDLLNFLSTKPNIKIMNDKEGQTLKNWINKTKKRVKWEPDVIIYYFLSRHDKWINISIKDFNKSFPNLPRYMIFEDWHYVDVIENLYKKYKFTLLLKPEKNKDIEEIYKIKNIEIKKWGFYIDSNKFKMRKLENGFKYDILLYGFINKYGYPLRAKFFEVLQFLNQKSNLRIKHIPHPGYNNGYVNKLPKNEELSKIINESRFTMVTSSFKKLYLKKYIEIPISGSTMIGDIPPDYPELKGKIIEIKRDASHDDIIQVIKKSFENKFIEIEKESRKYGLYLSNTKNFEIGYNELNKIIN
tara:strand:+ start:4167 stop:5129 length:963 start_codon:yes stop_codon:yes gene_type:complete